MVVRVRTRGSWVALASDAAHFHENFERDMPFPWVESITATLNRYERLRALADRDDMVVPGHDPQIMTRYPAASPDLEGFVARLD